MNYFLLAVASANFKHPKSWAKGPKKAVRPPYAMLNNLLGDVIAFTDELLK